MNAPSKLLARLAPVALLVALAACKDPAEGKPQATVSEAKPVPTIAASSASAKSANKIESLAFDEKVASVGFVGSKVTGSHEGKFGKVSGTITLVDGKSDGSQVKVTIDETSLEAEPAKLRMHLSGPDFFDVEKFPKATFESTEVKPAAAGGGKYDVTGNLDLHGVKKSISFPATITVDGDAVTVAAEFDINRKDFGINFPGKADDLIRDKVLIKLSIKAPRRG